MATNTPTPTETAPPPSSHERLIDERVVRTQRQLRGVDLAVRVLFLGIVIFVYLFVAAVFDQWVIKGGFGAVGRFIGFAILVVGAVVYFVRGVLPTLMHRINPLYAAQTIENNKPTVRNSLINFLLLRGEREHVPKPVYQALEYRAAGDLSTIPAETVVDRINVIRLGYVLITVLSIAGIYLLVSPKNPLTSAARFLFPWASIEAPTRVAILDVEPKDHIAFHGDRVAISAEVQGLADDEPVRLFFTTADGQRVDSAVTMDKPEGSYKYETLFPADELGLQQDLTYYLAAGDAKTPVYNISVRVAPTIRVKSTKLEYPEYTGLKPRVFDDLGDVRALEGTRVVVTGEANLPIKRAEIDLDCTGRRTIRMDAKDQAAVGSFTLRPDPSNPGSPEHDSYQLRFVDLEGNQNRRPIRHRIEMILDQRPRISFVDGPRQPIQLPADGKVAFTITAEDPDFGLRRVAFVAQRGGRSLPIRPILEKTKPEKAHAGPFEGKFVFSPAEFSLKPGDEIVYYAAAEDNKEPIANRSVTEQNAILIVEPQGNENQDQQPQDQQQDQGDPQQKQDGQKGDAPPEDRQDPNQEQKQDENKDQQESEEGKGESQEGGEGEQSQADDQEGAEQGKSESKPDSGQDGKSQDDAKSEGQKDGEQPKPGEEADPSQKGPPKEQKGEQGEAQEGGEPQEGQAQDGKSGQEGQKRPGEGKASEGEQQGDASSGESGEDSEKRPGEPGDSQERKTDAGGKPDKNAEPQGPIDQSNPGDAFEEILKDRRRQHPAEQNGGDRQQEGDGQQAQGEQKPTDKRPSDAEQGKVEGDAPGTPGEEKKDGTQPDEGEGAGKEKPSGDELKQEQGKPGESGTEKGDRGSENVEKKDGPETEATPDAAREDGKGDNRGDDPSADKAAKENPSGSGGDGQEEDPNRQKRVGDASGKTDREREETKKENDSSATGDTAGDRSGKSEEGGGMRSNQEGAGAAGQSEPSDAGGSKSQEKGDGETGARGGDQAEADQGPSEGEGQKAEGQGKPAESGQKGTPKPGEGQDSQSSGQQPNNQEGGPQEGGPAQQPGGATSDTPSGNRGTAQTHGGGQPGEGQAPPPQEDQEDAANREYSEEAVNLALEHLKDQMTKEEPELLDRLGWTKEEAKQFLQMWEQMQREAKTDEAAKSEWDKAIESLGLRPKQTKIKGGQTQTDQIRRLRDAGRFAPPPEWAEQFRAYTEGASGRASGETK